MFLSMTMALPRSFTIRSSLGKLKATVWGPFTSCKLIFLLSQFLPYKSPLINKSGHGGHHWEITFSGTSFRICGSQQFNELETAQNALLRDSSVKEIAHFEISASQEVNDLPYIYHNTWGIQVMKSSYPTVEQQPYDTNRRSRNTLWLVLWGHWQVVFQFLQDWHLSHLFPSNVGPINPSTDTILP